MPRMSDDEAVYAIQSLTTIFALSDKHREEADQYIGHDAEAAHEHATAWLEAHARQCATFIELTRNDWVAVAEEEDEPSAEFYKMVAVLTRLSER